MKSVFAHYDKQFYPYRFAGTLHLVDIAGGIPSDPKKAQGWIETNLGVDTDDRLRKMVAETMTERGVELDEAVADVLDKATLVGFKRDDDGLYYEGRQLKAALKESVSVAANEGKITTKGWGNPDNANYKKGIKGWFPEHVFVEERRLHLGVSEPSYVDQQFIHNRFGSSIQYQEIVEDCTFDFTVETDHEFTEDQWAAIWTTLERNGVGASRSRGFGRCALVRWDPID